MRGDMRFIGPSINAGSRWSGWLESTNTIPATSAGKRAA